MIHLPRSALPNCLGSNEGTPAADRDDATVRDPLYRRGNVVSIRFMERTIPFTNRY